MLAVADILYELEDYAAASERFREVHALRSARLGADHPGVQLLAMTACCLRVSSRAALRCGLIHKPHCA